MQDLELKRTRIEKLVKFAALLGIGFIVAPFIFISIKGLAGLLIAAAISWTAIAFTPWFAAKIGNWRLKALKHEAALNPIETLSNDYLRRHEKIQSFRESIRGFAGEVRLFAEKLDGFKDQYPKDAVKFDEQLSQMKKLLELRKSKYEEAKANLQLYDGEIQKARIFATGGYSTSNLTNSSRDILTYGGGFKVSF